MSSPKIKVPILETERLILRPYQAADLDALRALFGDPQVRRYLFDDEVWPRELVEQEIASNLEAFEKLGLGQWALELRESSHAGVSGDEGGLVGFCGFREFFEPPQLQLLYGLSPRAWGTGLATEAARAACEYGFLEGGLDRVLAATDLPNTASIEVMKRLGMYFVEERMEEAGRTVFYALDRPETVPRSYRLSFLELP